MLAVVGESLGQPQPSVVFKIYFGKPQNCGSRIWQFKCLSGCGSAIWCATCLISLRSPTSTPVCIPTNPQIRCQAYACFCVCLRNTPIRVSSERLLLCAFPRIPPIPLRSLMRSCVRPRNSLRFRCQAKDCFRVRPRNPPRLLCQAKGCSCVHIRK